MVDDTNKFTQFLSSLDPDEKEQTWLQISQYITGEMPLPESAPTAPGGAPVDPVIRRAQADLEAVNAQLLREVNAPKINMAQVSRLRQEHANLLSQAAPKPVARADNSGQVNQLTAQLEQAMANKNILEMRRLNAEITRLARG